MFIKWERCDMLQRGAVTAKIDHDGRTRTLIVNQYAQDVWIGLVDGHRIDDLAEPTRELACDAVEDYIKELQGEPVLGAPDLAKLIEQAGNSDAAARVIFDRYRLLPRRA